MYEELLELYDRLEPLGLVAPPAHTTITPKIGVLLGPDGNFLGARYLNETAIVPCTEQSEFRTSNTAPHLLHDNLSYVGDLPGHGKRFDAYMGQLEDYISHVDDPLAQAVHSHLSDGNGLLMAELRPILEHIPIPPERIPVVFGIPGMKTLINRSWMEYYISTLPVNGVCSITGEPAYIPSSYPKNLRKQGDVAKLFQKPGKNIVTDMPNCTPGYVATQKICHAIQWLTSAPDVTMGDGDGPLPPNYIPLKEYAKLHGVDPVNVRQKILRGNLEAKKFGNLWMIDKDTPYERAHKQKK